VDPPTVKILATADLHYDIARSRRPTEALAARVCAAAADAVVLVGDTAGADTAPLADCLALFADFGGVKLLVPGNHCLWCRDGEDSLTRYRQVLPAVAAEAGFTVLDHAPQVIGAVGLVGSIGWYDYGFREADLEVPLAFYRAKIAPGAAEVDPAYRHLIDQHGGELTERHYRITARWMDGQNIRLGIDDSAFAAELAETLTRQLAELTGRVERIVAFTHHLPFERLVPRGRPPNFAFAAAYMGSDRFGAVLAAEPKVTCAVSGHSHWPMRRRIGTIDVINIGSTYRNKRLEVLRV